MAETAARTTVLSSLERLGFHKTLAKGGNSVTSRIDRKARLQSDIGEDILSLAREYPVFLITRSDCPYSSGAKAILTQMEVPFNYADIDKAGEPDIIKEAAKRLTSKTGVPYIWINGRFIGGFEELVNGLSNGTLNKELTQIARQQSSM